MRFLFVVIMGLAFSLVLVRATSEAETLLVPDEYQDLGVALREAAYGDTVLVSPGRYRVQARVRSGVKLLSAEGPDSTVLESWRWYALKLVDCDIETKVAGFTFAGWGANACVVCTTGAPVILDNVIKESWDGISLYKCNAFIKGNTITGCNRGMYLEYSDPELLENKLIKNGDGISMISSAPVIARCRFERNGRAILILGHSYPTIGGMLTTANDFLDNSFPIYNRGLRIEGGSFTDQPEIAVATHNYWGTDCPPSKRFRGEVVFTPWTNAKHDTLFNECPEQAVSSEEKSR